MKAINYYLVVDKIKEAPKKVIEIPKGPVEITADGFYLLGKLGERLYKKATDQEVEPQSNYNILLGFSLLNIIT
mgnify:CR=1 FL=1